MTASCSQSPLSGNASPRHPTSQAQELTSSASSLPYTTSFGQRCMPLKLAATESKHAREFMSTAVTSGICKAMIRPTSSCCMHSLCIDTVCGRRGWPLTQRLRMPHQFANQSHVWKTRVTPKQCRPPRVMSSGALSEAQASTGRQSVEEDSEAPTHLHRLSQVNAAGQSSSLALPSRAYRAFLVLCILSACLG